VSAETIAFVLGAITALALIGLALWRDRRAMRQDETERQQNWDGHL
jgi:hypothetical protein